MTERAKKKGTRGENESESSDDFRVNEGLLLGENPGFGIFAGFAALERVKTNGKPGFSLSLANAQSKFQSTKLNCQVTCKKL